MNILVGHIMTMQHDVILWWRRGAFLLVCHFPSPSEKNHRVTESRFLSTQLFEGSCEDKPVLEANSLHAVCLCRFPIHFAAFVPCCLLLVFMHSTLTYASRDPHWIPPYLKTNLRRLCAWTKLCFERQETKCPNYAKCWNTRTTWC